MNLQVSTFPDHSFIRKLIVLMAIMSMIWQFASDNYLPSFSAIAQSFKTTPQYLSLSVSIFFLSIGSIQILYGILSDSYGRKNILIVGYLIFIIGCFVCALASSITIFFIGRLIQGCGIGANVALYRSILRDKFSGAKLSQVSSLISTFIALIPPIAPIIGGYIQTYFGWRDNFYFVIALSIIIIVFFIIYCPETHPLTKRQPFRFHIVLTNLKLVITDRLFMVYVVCAGLSTACSLISVLVSPYLFESLLHIPPEKFGWILSCITVSILVGGILNIKLTHHYKLCTLILLGSGLMLLSGLFFILLSYLQWTNAFSILFLIFLISIGARINSANIFACAVGSFDMSVGLASAIFGSCQFIISAIVSGLSSEIVSLSALGEIFIFIPLIIIFLVFVVNNNFIVRSYIRKN